MAQTETIIGCEGGLKVVLERAHMVASSDLPVLIFGETGTGKEVVARSIHERSPRRAGPFRRVNCGAVAPELIDSELFGHERGAFTGSIAQRRGWFEQAHLGTLFLDEIGELSLAAQVRLLRVLQDGELLRVGGETPVHVDVRIVAATHRDLAAMVASRTFREDLYYRLAVFPIVIPPLRDRTEDIPGLVAYFAERAFARFGLRHVEATAEDLDALAAYPWPGNVRELAAVLDRAVLLGEGKRVDVQAALGLGVNARPVRALEQRGEHLAAAHLPVAPAPPASDIEPLVVVMRRHIERALIAAHGRIDGPFGAARILALNPHTLRARMRKLKVDWRGFRAGSTSH
jgi:hydrogenase-4 transcriptional activator